MDRQTAVWVLEDSLKRAAATCFEVEGCWVGFLGSSTVLRFRSRSELRPSWAAADPETVARALAFVGRELPGLGIDPAPAAYEWLGAFHEDDGQGNITDDLLLRERSTGVYLLFREYAG